MKIDVLRRRGDNCREKLRVSVLDSDFPQFFNFCDFFLFFLGVINLYTQKLMVGVAWELFGL